MDVIVSSIFKATMSAHTIFGDALYVIAKFLNVKDIYSLSLVTRRGYRKIDKAFIMVHIKEWITFELKAIFGDHYERFVDAMIEAEAVLSGSFIIQCILNERWDNSDIDIYVDDKQSAQMMHNFFESEKEDVWYDNYGSFPRIKNITEYHINTPNYHFDRVKVQVVRIKTDDKYTLRHHVKNTGFDICRNMLYFDENGDMKVELENYRAIINKCTVFTILDTDDFFYRIEKYSKRGFHFKPKYRKMFYLEYIILKKFRARVGINKNKNSKFDPTECNPDCVVKLLFRNVKHYHVSGYYEYNKLFIDNDDGIIDGLVPHLRVGYKGDTLKFMWMVSKDCPTLDHYVKLRRRLTKDNSIFEPKTDLRYDIKYGLEYEPAKAIRIKKGPRVEKKHDNKGWQTVESKNRRNKIVAKKASPIETGVSWAEHLKKIHNKKN